MVLKVSTTLSPLWTTLFSTLHTAVRSRAGFFLSRLKVKTTSAAVIGTPSLHFTPLRIVNVSTLLPSLQA